MPSVTLLLIVHFLHLHLTRPLLSSTSFIVWWQDSLSSFSDNFNDTKIYCFPRLRFFFCHQNHYFAKLSSCHHLISTIPCAHCRSSTFCKNLLPPDDLQICGHIDVLSQSASNTTHINNKQKRFHFYHIIYQKQRTKKEQDIARTNIGGDENQLFKINKKIVLRPTKTP